MKHPVLFRIFAVLCLAYDRHGLPDPRGAQRSHSLRGGQD